MSSEMNSPSRTDQKTSKSLTDFSIDTIIGDQQEIQAPSYERLRGHLDKPIAEKNVPVKQSKCQPTASNTPSKKYRPKNFQCPACKMAFSNNGQLKNHVRIHTGERPFQCNFSGCNKTFTRNEELTRHKLIHTGVRPHACTTCGKRFGRKDHLKKHFRTHEKKRLKRKMFVSTGAYGVREDALFCPAKQRGAQSSNHSREVMIQDRTTQMANSSLSVQMQGSLMLPQRNMTEQARPLPSMPTDLIVNQSQIPLLPPLTAPMTTTSNAIQQLASDYWYGLLDLYRNQSLDPNR